MTSLMTTLNSSVRERLSDPLRRSSDALIIGTGLTSLLGLAFWALAARWLSTEAVGIGAAEFCRSRVIREMDTAATRLNALTAGDLTAAMRPLDYETDAEILEAALPMIGLRPPAEARILWIRNTLQLAEAECSSVLLEEASRRPDLEVASELRPLPLDRDGNLPDRIAFSGEEADG